MNRANAKVKIFYDDSDYLLFERTFKQAVLLYEIKILTYSIMPNHIHLVPFIESSRSLTKFMHWLTMTFTQRYHKKHGTTGTGHLFQGRYKAFLIKNNQHLLRILMYVDRNAKTAELVEKAEHWRWSGLWLKQDTNSSYRNFLSEIPIDIPENYLELVNEKEDDLEDITNIPQKKRGRPKKKIKKR